MLRIHASLGGTPANFHEKWAVQLNDTHPAVAVAELMRLLVDEHSLGWDEAWKVTRKHLCLHESHPPARGAGEMERRSLRRTPAAASRDHLRDQSPLSRRSCARNIPATMTRASRGFRSSMKAAARYVRMAHLATVGSHAVNGVAELHSELLKQTVMHDFAELWPEKFCNVTNGVTPRRFVALSNPGLSELITNAIGDWLAPESQSTARPGAVRRRCRIPTAMAGGEAGEQTPPRRAHQRAHRHQGVARNRSSTFRSSASTNTSASTSHALHILTLYLRLKRDPQADVPAAHFHLRRQSGARLFHGQAHHQADHRDRSIW